MQGQGNYGLVEVPEMRAPFAVDPGPYAEDAQSKHMKWADYHGIFRSGEERRRFAAMDIGALAGLLYPQATGPEDVRLVADWCAWLLLRDDRWDSTDDPKEWEHLARCDRAYLRLMRRAPAAPTPGEDDGLYAALADLCACLRESAHRKGLPDPVDRRLVAVMKNFFFASVRETAYQHREIVPTLSEYVRMRSVTGGLDILTFVLATLDGVHLPKKLLANPLVECLTAASHNVCCWHNDLVSLNKELASGEVHNLILVLRRDPEGGCRSLSEAVDTAERMIREEIRDFIRLEREVCAISSLWDHSAAWYARMLRNRVGGVIAWQEACATRYRETLAASKPSR